jgi:hypothetical protein
MAGLSIVLSHKAVRRESFHELRLMISHLPAYDQPLAKAGFYALASVGQSGVSTGLGIFSQKSVDGVSAALPSRR